MTTYTYTDATKVADELRATDAFSTATTPTLSTVNTWINEESALINHEAGRIYGSTSYTDLIDYDGGNTIRLKHTPVISITSVLYSPYAYGTADYGLTETEISGTDYAPYLESGELEIIWGQWQPKEGIKRIQVTYTAGYSTTPLTVQQLATKRVALRVLNSLIYNNVNESNDGGSVSVGSISIVEPASYGVNSYKQLKTDISDLTKEITGSFGIRRYHSYKRK